jgi:hypothetical protein
MTNRKSANFQGKTVMLVFWLMTCDARKELPILKSFQNPEYGDFALVTGMLD